ncbi:MAG: hypothetical protein KDB00_26925 [Planctomycetales bacterium]|nr:hypothetical protein [Planctomycetales bacterium]
MQPARWITGPFLAQFGPPLTKITADSPFLFLFQLYLIMWFRSLTIAFGFATLLVVPNANAQFPGDPVEVDEPSEPTPRADELVRQLESSASRGGLYRAQSIRSLAQLRAWPQVDRWLTQMDGTADQAILAESAQVIGPQLLLRISLSDELSDSGRSAISKMNAAAKATNQDVTRLRSAIDQLANDDVDANLQANRILMRGGDVTVELLVEAVAKGLPENQLVKVLAILRSLGEGGFQGLEQLALYGDPSLRPAVLVAIEMLSRDAAMDTLITAAFAGDASADESAAARAGAMIPDGFGKLDAVATLADRLETLREFAARSPNDTTPATLWTVNQDRTGVIPNRSTLVYQRYRDAYDAAQRLRRLGALPPTVGRSVLATDLSYRLMVDVDWGNPAQIKEFERLYPQQLDRRQLLTTLAEQRKRGDIPAALGAVRLLSSVLATDAPTEAVLGLRDGRFTELVDAVRDSNARIRFESAACITKLVGSEGAFVSFPGASYYRNTLSEMAALNSRPTAIVLETRPVIALRQESILGQLGYEVRLVESAHQAEREVASGGDLRLVISKIQISDAATAELVDRIRRQPRGNVVPIVFYRDAETSEKSVQRTELETTSNRWISENTPSVYLVDLPGSPAALTEVLLEVDSKRRLPPLSVADRSSFRQLGLGALQGKSSPR